MKKTDKLVAELNRIIATFESEEVLSQFELGQVDALRWIKQTIQEDYGNETRDVQSKRGSDSRLGK